MSHDPLVFFKEQFSAAFIASLERTIPKDRSTPYWQEGVRQGLVSAFYKALLESLQVQLKLSQNPQESLAWILQRIQDNYSKAQEIKNIPGLRMEELECFDIGIDVVQKIMLQESLSFFGEVRAYQRTLEMYFQEPSADMRYDPQNPKSKSMQLTLPARRIPNQARLLGEIACLTTRILFQRNIERLLDQERVEALMPYLFDRQKQYSLPELSSESFENIRVDLQKLFRLSRQDHALLERLVRFAQQQQLKVYEVFGAVADAHEFAHKRAVPSEIPILQILLARTARVSENGCFSASSQESTEIPKRAAKL